MGISFLKIQRYLVSVPISRTFKHTVAYENVNPVPPKNKRDLVSVPTSRTFKHTVAYLSLIHI